MYLFSCNATAKQALPEVEEGEEMPFIVYIDYQDLFGAEYLCKLYLIRAGFTDIEIEKRQQLPDDSVKNLKEKDSDIQQALTDGFHLRMFDCH